MLKFEVKFGSPSISKEVKEMEKKQSSKERLTVYEKLSAKLVKNVWNWQCSDCSKCGEKKLFKVRN